MNSTLSCLNCVNKQMSCCKHLEYSFEVRVVQIQGTGLSGSRNSEISGGSRYRVETFFVQEQNHIQTVQTRHHATGDSNISWERRKNESKDKIGIGMDTVIELTIYQEMTKNGKTFDP